MEKLRNIKRNRLDQIRLGALQDEAEFENAVRDATIVTYDNGTVVTGYNGIKTKETQGLGFASKVFHIMNAKTREVKAQGDKKLDLENAVFAASSTCIEPTVNPFGRKTVSIDMNINRDKLNKTHPRATSDDVLYAATLYAQSIVTREEEAMK